jgi:hypothetical protein
LFVWGAISDSVSAVDLSPGRVQVDPSIPYPEKMTFVGLSQSMLLGASMGTSGMVKEYVRNAAGQRRNLTPVPTFVREEFSEAIRAIGFTLEDAGPSDIRFRLAVRKYGFAEASMLSRQVRPLMTLYRGFGCCLAQQVFAQSVMMTSARALPVA